MARSSAASAGASSALCGRRQKRSASLASPAKAATSRSSSAGAGTSLGAGKKAPSFCPACAAIRLLAYSSPSSPAESGSGPPGVIGPGRKESVGPCAATKRAASDGATASAPNSMGRYSFSRTARSSPVSRSTSATRPSRSRVSAATSASRRSSVVVERRCTMPCTASSIWVRPSRSLSSSATESGRSSSTRCSRTTRRALLV